MAAAIFARRSVRVSLAIAASAGLGAGLAAGSDAPLERSEPAAGGTVLATSEASPTPSPTPAPPPPIRRTRVGRGATGAVVVTRGPLGSSRPVVIFLHGWGIPISRYDAWVEHMVRVGNTVIAPRYQRDASADPATVRAAAVAGVRRALRRMGGQPEAAVYAGHSAGGALAADLAAEASGGGLPDPAAVFAVYPGRAIYGYPAGIPAASLSRLPRTTRLLALAGADDSVVGQAPAQQLAAAATSLPPRRRRYVLLDDSRIDDHFAPTRRGRAAQREFWDRLDRLAARARQ